MTRKLQLKFSTFIATAIAVACGDPSVPKPREQTASGGTASTLVGGGRAGQTGRGGVTSTTGDGDPAASGGNGSEPFSAGGVSPSTGGRTTLPATQNTGGNAAHSAGSSGANSAVTGGVGGSLGPDGEPPGGAGGNETGGTTSTPAERIQPYFSEYLENGSYKALEIAAAQPGSLSDCGIHVHANGGKTLLRSIALNENITPDAPLVLCSQELAGISTSCQRVENLRFNGNDVIELACAGIVFDVFGRLGDSVDPGWGNGNDSTAGRDLRRDCDVTSGDRDSEDPFDPSGEWQSFAPTDLSGLGSRCTPLAPTSAGAGGASGGDSNGGAAGSE